MKTTIYKKHNILALCCLMLVLSVQLFGIFNSTQKVNASAPDGIEAAVGGDTKTMYYLRLPIKNKAMRISGWWSDGSRLLHLVSAIGSGGGLATWNYAENTAKALHDRTHTFVFTHNNITINTYAFLTTAHIRMNADGWGNFFRGYITFYAQDNIDINIRSEYYDYFQGGDFSNVSVTYMYGGEGYRLTDPNAGDRDYFDLSAATLHTREVPADYNPIIEEGVPPDNGGVAVDPNPTVVETFLERVTGVFESGTKAFSMLAIVVGMIVVAVVIYRIVPNKNNKK